MSNPSLDEPSQAMLQNNGLGERHCPIWVARIDRFICWVGRFGVVSTLIVILVFSFAQVLDRYAFKSQFDAWSQIARIAMVWGTFVGAAMALRERRNLVIELIDSKLPFTLRKIRDRLFNLSLLVLTIVLLIKSLRVVQAGMWQNIVGTPFTYAISYAALTTSMALFAFFLLLRLIWPRADIPKDIFEHSQEEPS